MNKRLKRMLEPGNRLFFVVLILFALVTAFFEPVVAVCELAAILLLYIVFARYVHSRRRDVVRYIEQVTANLDSATKDSVVNFPLPMVIVRIETGEILWSNAKFTEITGEREHLFETRLSDVVPGFDVRWVIEGKSEYPGEVTIRDHVYSVLGNVVRSSRREESGFLGTVYFKDITELSRLRRENILIRPVICVIIIDSYEEIMKSLSETARSTLLAQIDEKISVWTEQSGGVVRKYERDKYLFLFEERCLPAFKESRFNILDAVRELKGSGDIPVTVSVGIGRDGQNLAEDFSFAQLAIDMALSRGGDQAVIKHRLNFEFYGGHSKEVEKRTKVKSRIMASALQRLVTASSQVLVMGHTGADIDAVGAAAGVCCIARKCGIPARIVVDESRSPAGRLIEILRETPEYRDKFIDAQTAILHADASTLLVVVDCNRPEIVESGELLQTLNRVAVIDHHRRSATYIDKADLNFHEPYASSASELVSELLRYLCDAGDLLRSEAAALLAGIVLDTKNFTLHTGVSTFEAAAFLRSAGADTVNVKKLFQTELENVISRYDIIRTARFAGRDCAIAIMKTPVNRTIAAQAADELLGIHGVSASFVVFPEGNMVIVSARSMGEFNVQLICEKLGGGGHQAMAGAQIRGESLSEVAAKLAELLENYYD